MPKVTEQKEKSRTVRYPAPLDAWIEKRAQALGITVSEFLRYLALKDFDSRE